ncbi:MAG TPA: DoxX family protein [Pyrinomonadaceae bacterium]|nr:DoxX family protein [Pyrinomonadaceae bacterium]
MANHDSFVASWTPRILSILRIIAGFLILQHGLQKVLGMIPPPPRPGQPPFTTPPLMSLGGASGLLELIGGILLIIGLFTRPVAFIMSGLLAVAYFMAHAPRGFWPILNQGELAALYSFVFLYLAVAGGGEWSLDRLLGRDRAAAYGARTTR